MNDIFRYFTIRSCDRVSRRRQFDCGRYLEFCCFVLIHTWLSSVFIVGEGHQNVLYGYGTNVLLIIKF